MVSTDAILFYVISLLNSGDSSLRFGMTIYYFVWEGGKKWRFAEIYRRGPKQSFRIATSFPPLPQSRRVIPSASEESPAPLTICLQLLRQKITDQRRSEESLEFVLSRMERHPYLQ
jgi:hypothetical protein